MLQLIQISKKRTNTGLPKNDSKTLEKLNLKQKESQTEKKFYTREETTKLLDVSLTTFVSLE